MPSVPECYRGCDRDDLALMVLADALDPPPAGETAADPEPWRAAVADARASLGLPPPVVAREAPRTSPMTALTGGCGRRWRQGSRLD
jgi:hypothetical protein